jgi:hypothetical protein
VNVNDDSDDTLHTFNNDPEQIEEIEEEQEKYLNTDDHSITKPVVDKYIYDNSSGTLEKYVRFLIWIDKSRLYYS